MHVEGETTFEQLPSDLQDHTHTHKPWALIIIVVVLIAVGAFWYYERAHEVVAPQPINTVPVTDTTPTQPQASIPTQPDDLQAAAINTAIPDFSKDF